MNTRRSFKKVLALLLCLVMFATLLPTFAFADLAAPTLGSATATANGIRVTWSGVSGASSYLVYRKTGSGSWGRLGTTTAKSYTDTTAKDGVTYSYTVRCLDGGGNLVSGHQSPGVSATWTSTVLAAPELKSATATASGIKVSWVPVEGISNYQIYRKSGSSSWGRIGTSSGSSYTDTSAKVGNTYTYTVRCLNSSGNLCSKHDSTGVTATYNPYSAPVLISAEAAGNGILVKWKAVSGAPAYMVYRKDSGSWGRLAVTTNTSYTDTTANVNIVYTYTVRVCRNESVSSAALLSWYDSTGVKASFAGKAAVDSVENKFTGVEIKWSSMAGVSKYRVYRKSGAGGWTKLADVSGTSYTDTTAVSNNTYRYTIRGLDSSNEFVGTWDSTGKQITFYAAPTLVEASDENNGIRVTWETVEGIGDYRVYRKVNSGSWIAVAVVSGTNYLDTSVASGVQATYTVRCVINGKNVSWYDKTGVTATSTNFSPTYNDPPLLTGAAGSTGGIKVTWQAVDGVSQYRVYRKDSSKTSWDVLKVVTGGKTEYLDTTAKVGGRYSYTVACYDGSKDTSEKNEVGLSATYYLAPTMKEAKNVNNGVEVTWNAVDGVGSYRVYRKTGNGSWTVIASAVSGTSYIDTTARSTYKYHYSVSCVVNGAEMSAYDETGVSTTFFSTPHMTSAAVTSANGITIKWNPVDGISKYRVYRAVGSGSYVKLVDVSDTSYTDTTVSSGTKYTYTIRCVVGANYCSGFESAGKSVTFYAAPTLVSATGGAKKVSLKWNSVSGANMYQVYRKTETGSWGRLATTAAVTYTDTTAKSGVKYFYTVRVCTTDGSTMLSWYQTPGLSATAS